eukprot:1034098-Rhodomonas_salina.1
MSLVKRRLTCALEPPGTRVLCSKASYQPRADKVLLTYAYSQLLIAYQPTATGDRTQQQLTTRSLSTRDRTARDHTIRELNTKGRTARTARTARAQAARLTGIEVNTSKGRSPERTRAYLSTAQPVQRVGRSARLAFLSADRSARSSESSLGAGKTRQQRGETRQKGGGTRQRRRTDL